MPSSMSLMVSSGDSSARQSVAAYLAHRKAGEGISLPAVLEQIRRQKEVEAYEMESSQIGRALEQLMRDLDEAAHPPTNPPKSP
jgi:hypothetical protein